MQVRKSRQITTFFNHLIWRFFFSFLGIFALLSTIPTAGSLHMHFMNLRNQFVKFYTKDRLKFTGYFGIFLAPIGFIGKLISSSSTILKIWFFLAALCYLIIALVNKIPFLPIEGSLLLAALQAFLTFKESATLAYFSRKHYKKIDQNWGSKPKRLSFITTSST